MEFPTKIIVFSSFASFKKPAVSLGVKSVQFLKRLVSEPKTDLNLALTKRAKRCLFVSPGRGGGS
ncbi:MAG: hypothetical protein ABDH49_02745 [Candidatus Hydrothermales bacterium]